jgi:aminoglycoside phosphotransferase (APT) family kinase protein
MTKDSSFERFIDAPHAVRAGEELDVEKVAEYLRATLPEPLAGAPEVGQFAGGASNLTYLLRYPERQLVLRRAPFGHKAKGAHDMVREAHVMEALSKVYPYVPAIVAICEDEGVLGAPFYVMERIEGVIVRRDPPPELGLDAPERARALCLSVVDRLIELHRIDHAAAGLSQLGKGPGYVARQIGGWSDRYLRSRTPDVPDCKEVMAWLDAKKPASEVAIAVIHNDYRFDNVVLDPNNPIRVIGVLDWEMATLGDPLMDLGNSIAYWVQADDEPFRCSMRGQPTNLPGMFTRAEVVQYYGEKTGLRVDNFDFYEVYGMFRLAVILQQIYYRYYHRQTQNQRFATFGQSVSYLEGACRRLIERSKL